MHAVEIAQFIAQHVPIFANVNVIGAGVAYHYTCHAEAIIESGSFYGAPLTANLDKTQSTAVSVPATTNPGVVFAYSDLAYCAEEGDAYDFACTESLPQIFEIHYREAVQTTHTQERDLDPSDSAPTILISTKDILKWRHVGPCYAHWGS